MKPINANSIMFRFLPVKKKKSVLIYGVFDRDLAEGLSYDYEEVSSISAEALSDIYKYDVKLKRFVRNDNDKKELSFDLIVNNHHHISIWEAYFNSSQFFLPLAKYMHSGSKLAMITNNFYIKTLSQLFRPTLNRYIKILNSSGFKSELIYSIRFENELPVQISLFFPQPEGQLVISSEPESGVWKKISRFISIDGCLYQHHLVVVEKC